MKINLNKSKSKYDDKIVCQTVRREQELLRGFDRRQIFLSGDPRYPKPTWRSTDHQYPKATHQRHGREKILRIPFGEVWLVWIHAPDADPVGSGRPTGDWKVGWESNPGAGAWRVEKLVKRLQPGKLPSSRDARGKPMECDPYSPVGLLFQRSHNSFIYLSVRVKNTFVVENLFVLPIRARRRRQSHIASFLFPLFNH